MEYTMLSILNLIAVMLFMNEITNVISQENYSKEFSSGIYSTRNRQVMFEARADIYIKLILYNQNYYGALVDTDQIITGNSRNTCLRYRETVRVGTGTFVAKNWIVTSAYLVRKVNITDIVVLTGRRTCYDLPRVINVQQIIVHRYFNGYDHDVALMKVEPRDAGNTPNFPLVFAEPHNGSPAVLTSWTRNKKGNMMKLSCTIVKIYNRSSCQKYYAFPALTNRNLCALRKTQRSWDFSIGDPITQGGRLVGYFQGNYHPGVKQAPAIYVNTAASRLWIKTTMLVN